MDSLINSMDRNSYIIKDSKAEKALGLFSYKLTKGSKGLCITRTNPIDIKRAYNLNIPFVWLNSSESKSNPDYYATSDITELDKHISKFLKENPKSVVLLDRIDYLINMHGFNNVLKFVYSLNDTIQTYNSLLMLNINPDVLNPKEMSLLEQEFHELPKPKFESELQDDLHEILLFMNNSNQKISFKDISKKFSITKTTTRKRVNRLIESGLAVVKKNGRNKIIRATELGKSIL